MVAWELVEARKRGAAEPFGVAGACIRLRKGAEVVRGGAAHLRALIRATPSRRTEGRTRLRRMHTRAIIFGEVMSREPRLSRIVPPQIILAINAHRALAGSGREALAL